MNKLLHKSVQKEGRSVRTNKFELLEKFIPQNRIITISNHHNHKKKKK